MNEILYKVLGDYFKLLFDSPDIAPVLRFELIENESING